MVRTKFSNSRDVCAWFVYERHAWAYTALIYVRACVCECVRNSHYSLLRRLIAHVFVAIVASHFCVEWNTAYDICTLVFVVFRLCIRELASSEQLQNNNPGSQRHTQREKRDRTERLFSYARHQAAGNSNCVRWQRERQTLNV